MKKLLLSALLALGFVAPAHAQQAASALILSACGTLPAGLTYAAGQYGIQTMDTTGKSCSGATFSGSVSATTAATSQSTLPTLSPSASSPIYESLGAGLYVQPVFGSASGGGTQVDATHGLPTNCIAGCAGGTQPNNADGVAAVSTGLGQTQDYPFLYNGSTFDRWRGDLTNGAFVNVKTSVLPTGAATSALQTTGNTALTTINTTLGTPMQQTGGSVTATQATGTNLHMVCDSGCSGSGGTSSNFGSAFPSAGTAIGLTNGTNMVAWSATANYGTSPGAIAVPAVNAAVTTSTPEGAVGDSAWVSGNGSIIAIAKTIATNTGSAIPAGSAVIGALTANQSVNLSQVNGVTTSTGTGVTGTGAQRVTVSTDQATNAGAALVKGGVGVVNGGSRYQAVAASATATVLQSSTGATGDYLSHCVIYPQSTSPGVVTVFDGSNSAANSAILFAGGATSVSNLAPIPVPVGAISRNGAWEVTTGTNVSVVCYGSFS